MSQFVLPSVNIGRENEVLNYDLNDRTPVSDLFGIADSGGDVKRIVCYNKDTLNTPYKAGITIEVTSGTAFISMYSGGNWGMILCMVNGGVRNSLCICMKTNGTWGNWGSMVTNQNLAPAFTQIGAFDIESNYSNAEPEGNSYYITTGKICIVNLRIKCIAPLSGNTYVTNEDAFPCPSNGKYGFGSFAADGNEGNAICAGINSQGRLYFKRGIAGVTYAGEIVYVTA